MGILKRRISDWEMPENSWLSGKSQLALSEDGLICPCWGNRLTDTASLTIGMRVRDTWKHTGIIWSPRVLCTHRPATTPCLYTIPGETLAHVCQKTCTGKILFMNTKKLQTIQLSTNITASNNYSVVPWYKRPTGHRKMRKVVLRTVKAEKHGTEL